jgi:hypothetical protein
MAVIKKTLFAKNLEKFGVLVNDTQSDSKYFKITELPNSFTGGKNAFLIAGSEYLVPDTKIQIELKDSAGNIIYHEPGEGMINTNISGSTNTSIITEYYEGVSKVVSVYVYPDTAYGICTLTILGELSEYQDANGVTLPVPLNWENKYNVKWQKQIDVNPSLANTTKIRFYKRPTVTISELLDPVYRIDTTTGVKVNTGINQSFANIKISNLETFAGDVKRVKVFRTSLGDISDYDLIQDILVESKELLTTFGLSGSVIGNTGTFTSETLKNYWITGSLMAYLTSSRVESGVALRNSGNFIHSASLDIKSANTYELNLDAFYSSSTSSNLGIYLSYVSQSTTFTSSIATLVGTQPTKNLLDTIIPFKTDRDYPSASLYFSQSQGEWHLGNISLRLSQDTAFSPDEISFITTMPTVVGNEDFNFKFEFYDVNNNYVPVLVTGSANFTGGSNTITKLLTFESDRTAFRFSTGSFANPPIQFVKFKTAKTNFTGSITYASSAFDVGGTYIEPSSYAGTYPGWFTSQNDNGALLSIASFSGSVNSVLVGSIVYTASCEGFTEFETIYRFEDGDNAPGVFVTANTNQFIYKATDLSLNPTGQVITIEAKRKNLVSATTPLTVNSGSGKPPLTLVSTNTTNGIDTYTLAGSSFPFTTGESIYFISGSDQFGNEFSDAIKITPVKILDGLSATLTNDNASLPALSNGFVASGSFVLTSGSVNVKVGNENILFDDDNDSVRVNNTFAITNISGTGCTPNTDNNSNPITNTYGITNLTADSGSLDITINYKDGAGDTTDIVKTVTYTKNKKAAPVLTFVIGNNNQSADAKSTGEQISVFSDSTLSVKEQYNGTSSNLTLLSAPTINSSSAFVSITKTTTNLSYPNMVNGTDSIELSITGSVTDSEGTNRQVFGNVSLTKVKKAAPLTLAILSSETQTILSSSVGFAAPATFTTTVTEGGSGYTYDAGLSNNNTYYVSSITGGSNSNGTITPTTPTTNAGTTVSLTISYKNSEGSTGTITKTHKVGVSLEGIKGTNGTNGDTGADGRRTATGMIFYQPSAASAPATPSATSYTFSSNSFGSLTTNWGVGAPTYAAGNSNKYWYSTYTAVETTAGGGTAVPTFSAPAQAINFTGLVTFTSANNISDGSNTSNIVEPGSVANHIGGANVTTIEGGKISTGIITSTGYILPAGQSLATGTYTSAGTIFNLDNGSLRSKNFYINSSGDAFFKGTLTIAGTDLTAANTLNTQANIEAGLGYIPTTAGAAATAANSAAKTAGTVGGWTIASNAIFSGTNQQTDGYQASGVTFASNGAIHSKNFFVNTDGTAGFKGTLTVGGTDLTTTNTLNDNTTKSQVGLANVENLSAQNQAQTGLIAGTTITGGGITLSGGGNIKGGQTDYNTGTGFFLGYHGSAYKFSIGNASSKGITWDGGTLSIGGDVSIGVNLASALTTTTALSTGLGTKISTGGAAGDVNSGVTKISGGQIVADSISANQISSLSFSGKTATFDQGSVGGWTMDSTGLYKTTGAYTLRLGANSQRISISQANVVDSIDRVRLDSSLDIPTITVSDTGSLYWSAAGQHLLTVYDNGSPNSGEINTDFDTPDGSPTHPPVSFVYGIIGLVYASEEIFVESEGFPNIDNTIIGQSDFAEFAEVSGYYNVTLRVRKFPTSNDALNQTNADAVYGDKQVLVAYKEFRHNQLNGDRNIDKVQIYGATLPADGPGGINTPAPGGAGNWYRVELRQIWNITAYSPTPQEFGGGSISAYRPASDIFVKFGRVTNGYSVFSPGGLQVYQGVRNYLNASLPSGSVGDSANFFIVKGKSQIIGSLDVTSGFSANSKQFKIEHPLNENKWLYHTSMESPRADLIYRGTLQLQNGAGSASIDLVSNMTNGTFNVLTKNAQLFLQNNESFDRIKGYVQSGSVYVSSENQNSTASIDWSVIAERQDTEILKSPLYDRNGNYKTENYKGEYLEKMRAERFAKFEEI